MITQQTVTIKSSKTKFCCALIPYINILLLSNHNSFLKLSSRYICLNRTKNWSKQKVPVKICFQPFFIQLFFLKQKVFKEAQVEILTQTIANHNRHTIF